MPQDIPVSHSMDSLWFAVDQEGHVAVFDTGEPCPTKAGFPSVARRAATRA